MEPTPVAQGPIQPDSAVTHGADANRNRTSIGPDVQNLPLRPKANATNIDGNHNDAPASQQHTQMGGSAQGEEKHDDIQNGDYGVASNVPPVEEKKKKKKKKRKPPSKRGLVLASRSD